jgi:hypothetical protein
MGQEKPTVDIHSQYGMSTVAPSDAAATYYRQNMQSLCHVLKERGHITEFRFEESDGFQYVYFQDRKPEAESRVCTFLPVHDQAKQIVVAASDMTDIVRRSLDPDKN